jgi:hypothetical protein
MRISFDLDDTLICHQQTAKYEKNRVPLFLRFVFNEKLRLGTRFLIRELRNRNHKILIYTSSYRNPFFLKLWFVFYGIIISEVINQKIHNRYVKTRQNQSQPSKNPKFFGIDLHIDDSIGVQMEGERYGFNVLVLAPDDEAWVDKVIKAVNAHHDNI